MRVLIDTTYLYALMVSRALFTGPEREFLEERDAHIVVSAVSTWEMRIKYGRRHPSGARKSPFDPQRVLEALRDQESASFRSPRIMQRRRWKYRCATRTHSTNCFSHRPKSSAFDS